MLADGIYCNLPMAIYREDPALGGSDLGDILANAVQWHARNRNRAWRELNPPSEEESAATRFGTALHTILLEPETFEERYFEEPEAPNWPDTKPEIAGALKRIGAALPKSGADKAEYQAFARQHGVSTMADWRSMVAVERGERETISPFWRRSLQLLRKVFDAHPKAPSFLRNGRAEVSVFWTDTNGIRLKCRFDYLRVRTVADVKSYALREGMEPIACFVQRMEAFGYDFSAAHYMQMRTEALPALVGRGLMYDGAPFAFGAPDNFVSAPTAEFLTAVAAEPDPSWHFIACATMGWPEVDCIEFPTMLTQFGAAAFQVEQAKEIYRAFRDKFGDDPETPWVADRKLVRLTDFMFSQRASGRGAVRWEAA